MTNPIFIDPEPKTFSRRTLAFRRSGSARRARSGCPVLIGVALCLVLFATWSCGTESDPIEESTELKPVTRIATQNAGTTRWMDMLVYSPLREVCADWYGANMCVAESEEALAEAIIAEQPDILMLQEIWDQTRCGRADRPAEVDTAPYVCSLGDDLQVERILPPEYHFGCAPGYRDNCIVFHEDVFVPDTPQDITTDYQGRDCSDLVVSNPAPCGPDGRVAYLEGQSAYGPTILVVVHTIAGPEHDDSACRAQQLAAIQQVLEEKPSETTIIMAGDFNLDPELESGDDVAALNELKTSLELERLPDEGNTHRLLHRDLDLVLVRGWPHADSTSCSVQFVDEGAEVPMFDHAFLSCAAGEP